MTDTTQDTQLFSEGWLFAALLEMLVDHCGTGQEWHVKSFGRSANLRAIQLLAEAGYVDIAASHGDDIEARVSPSGRELLALTQRIFSSGPSDEPRSISIIEKA